MSEGSRRNRSILLLALCITLMSVSACAKKEEPIPEPPKEEQAVSTPTGTVPTQAEPSKEAQTKATEIVTPTKALESSSDVVEGDLPDEQKEKLVQQWMDAYCSRSSYILSVLYKGDGAYQQQTYEERYDQIEQILYPQIMRDWTMSIADCHYESGAGKASIWYSARENDRQAVVIRQNLQFTEADGELKVDQMEQTIYDSINTKTEYEEAYLSDSTLYYYDYYQYLCDLEMLAGEHSVYENPGTAAQKTLRLTGGQVKEIEYPNSATDNSADSVAGSDNIAQVVYEFSDGNVTIPMYKTYSGVWLPGEEGISMSRLANSDFMTLTAVDYENAVDMRDAVSWYGVEDAKLYLLGEVNGVHFYGADADYLVVEEYGQTRPYPINWRSPIITDVKFVSEDYDKDDKEEIACTVHLGTGAGVSVESLYLFDYDERGRLHAYEYMPQQYIRELESLYTYTYDQDKDEVLLYVSGRPITPAIPFRERVRSSSGETAEKIEFESVTVGDYITFPMGEEITIHATLEGWAKGLMSPGCYPGELEGIVHYYGNGDFYLTSVILSSYDSEPYQFHESGVRPVAVGKSESCDLDGDGKKEKITFKTVESKLYPGEMEPRLTIGKKQYNSKALQDMGVYLLNMDGGFWHLTDLDTTDSYQEIVLYDTGPSYDPVTYFLRYDGKQLMCCGAVQDDPDRNSFAVHGDGTVTAKKRLDILQTWWADTQWRLNAEGILEETPTEWFRPYLWSQDEYTKNCFKKDVKLYASPDKEAATIPIAKGTQIYLTATDDQHWVEVTTFDWTVGWMYIEEYDTIQLPEETIKADQLMTYLCFAD